MSHFEKAFADLLKNEGGYSNNPNDSGGATKYGITEKVARENGYSGAMIDLPELIAAMIYRTDYWNPVFDRFSYAVAFQLFDMTVNSGKTAAVKTAQRSVGVTDDGIMGPITISAIEKTDPLLFALGFNAQRIQFLTALSTWTTFGKGWMNRVANNLKIGALS